MSQLRVKRTYDDIEKSDGYRILIDGMWPRGISKEDLEHDDWVKEIAPSKELREEFNHEADKWDWFQKEYKKELDDNEAAEELATNVDKQLNKSNVTLLFSAKDEDHNNALVLQEWLNDHIDNEPTNL